MLVDYDSDKSRSDPGHTPNANGEHDVSLLLLLATALGTALCWPIEQPDYTCPASTVTGMSSNIPVYNSPGAVHMLYPQACQAHSQDQAPVIKEVLSTLPAQAFMSPAPTPKLQPWWLRRLVASCPQWAVSWRGSFWAASWAGSGQVQGPHAGLGSHQGAGAPGQLPALGGSLSS